MMRGTRSKLFATIALALAAGTGLRAAQPASAPGAFLVEPIAERTVTRLSERPLHWRIETFPSLTAAQAAAGPLSLAAEHAGRAWLFTLGARREATPGGRLVIRIGPVP